MPSDERRLHPASLLFGLGNAARSLLVPGLFVLFASGRGSSYEAWFMLLFIPAVIGTVVRYLTFSYRLGEDEMMVRDGILTRNERHIPYAKIQNIDLVQNPLHRMMNVAVARLETASGGKPEAVIRVLSLEAVEEMRARVLQQRREVDAAVQPADPTHELLRLPLRELVLFGVISNRGMVVVAAVMGLLYQSGVFDIDVEERMRELVEDQSWVSGVAGNPIMLYVMLAVAALVLVLILLRVLSISWAIVKFHGFRLTLTGEDLRAEYGLFTRVSATIPRHRVQLISTRMSKMHSWFDRSSIQVETAGGGGGGDDQEGPGRERLWLAPIIPRSQVDALMQQVWPDVDPAQADWQPVASGARGRLFRRGLVLSAIVTAVAVAAAGPWGLPLLLAGGLLAWNHGRLYLRHTGWALDPAAVLYRSGWWVKRLSVVRLSKIQSVALSQSPFDRRATMATLKVDTAGAGRTGHRIAVEFLGLDTAWQLMTRLYDEASLRSFRW